MGARLKAPQGLVGFVALAFLALAMACGSATGGPSPNPLYTEMLKAAGVMQEASRILYAEKSARGLLPSDGADPNRTGMIGFEYTPMTTEQADAPSKRTTTNPDFAAALVRLVASLGLPPGTPVVLALSGSFVGADVAMLAAVEVLDLRPVLVVSAGTSQWGANNPEFNLLDMLALFRERGVIRTRATVAVIGGPDGAGAGMDDNARAALRASAARDRVPLVETHPLSAVIDGIVAHVDAALGGSKPGAVINVGGAVIGPGTCNESFTFPTGITTTPLPCSGGGTPGVLMRYLSPDVPAVQILNIRRLAIDLGLPYDPIPLPAPGENPAVYGPRPAAR
jgi:poly-gamma-glutamate system protein